jgi:hypothetical protein
LISGRTGLLLLLLLFPSPASPADRADSLIVTEGFRMEEGWTARKGISTGLAGALVIGSLVDSYYAWWKDSSRPFTFRSEGWFGGGHAGIDKLGHLFTSFFYFHTVRNLLLWGGHHPSTATWWSVGLTAFFAVSIEVGDGVSEYAFDYQDLVFNAAGLGCGLLQTEIPALRNFTLKWSFVPESGYRFPPRFTQDYDGHIYWLAVNVNALLPDELEPYWPDLLQVAGGYSVAEGGARSEYAVGFDLRLSIFDPPSPEAKLLIRTVDYFHVPMPGVKFSPGAPPDYEFLLLN